ncbi:MAG: class C sortase [Bifidobacterium sp.]|jgi:sortase A|nr:class C sortase [Bifidobacterium sp.]
MVLAGAAILLYPSAASWVSQYNQSSIVAHGVPDTRQSDAEKNAKALSLAHEYNEQLTSDALYRANTNTPSSNQGKDLHTLYEQALDAGNGLMARVQIPSIGLDLPIYHGTADDTLLEGVGHLEGTSLPVGGKGTHAVLTGHRGLAQATMFTNLDKVKDGDLFTVSTFGQVLTYRVTRIQVVDPDQTRSLQAVEGKDLVTLVTCTPLGINTQRIFVTGERITPTPQSAIAAATDTPDVPGVPWWLFALLAVVAMDLIWLKRALQQSGRGKHIGKQIPADS